jgi:hypothetical protein
MVGVDAIPQIRLDRRSGLSMSCELRKIHMMGRVPRTKNSQSRNGMESRARPSKKRTGIF